jgi:hypothetical protein
MPQFYIELHLEIEAENKEEAERIVDKILNAKFEPEVDSAILSFRYDEIMGY